MKSLSFEEFQATRQNVPDLAGCLSLKMGEPGFVYEGQIYVQDISKPGKPGFTAQVGRETYVSDRLDRVECWLWEEITSFTCPLNKPGVCFGDLSHGVYPQDHYTYVVVVEELVAEQVEATFNNHIGAENGFGDALWLNFAAIDKLWENKAYVIYGAEGVALYKHDDRFELLVMTDKGGDHG